ncbi:hypothetical protein [Bacillus sp. SRB1LM]|uniref:hypothetical protein n=1 Tax=Bacillus sp. SRB1LM TaxID=2608688 RepID=UPI0018C3CB2C|nr:hypothetical protein [Bacillus sp. SRB1LM]MBG0962418.1 hypothetical protein [Bacillus sp. SRB1LM]
MYGEKKIVDLLNDSQHKDFDQLPVELRNQVIRDFYGDDISFFKTNIETFIVNGSEYRHTTVCIKTQKYMYMAWCSEHEGHINIRTDDTSKKLVEYFLRSSSSYLTEVKELIEEVESHKCRK